MLALSNSNIKSINEKEDAKTLIVEESFSFSKEDTDNGFNAPNTSYTDARGETYPKIEELSLHLFSYLIPYKPIDIERIDLEVTRTNYSTGLRELTLEQFNAVDFKYSDIAYKWNISIPDNQGVVETYLIALPLDDVTSNFFYDTSERVIKKVVNGEISIVEDSFEMIQAISNKATKRCLFIPKISQTFSEIENKILYIYKDDCKDEKLLKKLTFLENIIRIGANAAINEAEVGMYSSAQENVEMLENIIQEHEQLWN